MSGLTSADPQPPIGTLVRDSVGGRLWRRHEEGYYWPAGTWLQEDASGKVLFGDDPETWVKVAGNYGPVTIVEQGASDD